MDFNEIKEIVYTGLLVMVIIMPYIISYFKLATKKDLDNYHTKLETREKFMLRGDCALNQDNIIKTFEIGMCSMVKTMQEMKEDLRDTHKILIDHIVENKR